MNISMSKKIREILKEKKMTMTALCILIGKSKQNMANKMKRDNFSMNDLIEIAEALDCKLDVSFVSKATKNDPENIKRYSLDH